MWGLQYSEESDYLRVYMAQIRRSSKPDAAHPPFEFLFLDSTFKNDPHGDEGLAVDVLVPGALLLIDDMTPEWKGHDHVRESLFQNPLLRSVEVLTTRETSAIISARR